MANKTLTSNPASNDTREGTGLIVVGIGASAGGVEALEELFVNLPNNLDMAFVVVQHLSPDFESLMPQILARKTSMPVFTIAQGMELKPNSVYVLPHRTNVTLKDHVLQTSERSNVVKQDQVDSFFQSLANQVGKNSIGVVLTGTGSDGSEGVKEIHRCGGLVVVQSESDAKFDGMPKASISTGIADAIVSLDEIPSVLSRLGKCLRTGWVSPPHAIFAEATRVEITVHEMLKQHFGLETEHYKPSIINRRLDRRIFLSGEDSITDYTLRLASDPHELATLFADLFIGETEFFRNPETYIELKNTCLRRLVDSAKGTLRVWVPACATGEEVYSLSIVLDELVSELNPELELKIFATDINSSCIEFASDGVYAPEKLKNIGQDRIRKYFKQIEHGFTISRHLRQRIVFAVHDVLKDAPFTKIDFVSCRNLLNYLKPNGQKQLLSLLNFSLRKNGYLLLGANESTDAVYELFEETHKGRGIFRKATSIGYDHLQTYIRPQRQQPTISKPLTETANVPFEAILNDFLPPSVIVNNQDQIQHIFGDATTLLQLPQGPPTNNLFHLLPEEFRQPVSQCLQRLRIETIPESSPYYASLGNGETYRIGGRQISGYANLSLLTFEISEQHDAQIDTVQLNDAVAGRVIALEDELSRTRSDLHETIIQLRATNQEIHSTNEQLTASNEELQSTNEELHSVNEELYTVNAEHQRKISELTELTDDMDNLLDSLKVDTVYLDSQLRVRKFTLGIAETIRLLPQDIGREFSSFNHEIIHSSIIELMQEVLRTEKGIDEEVRNHKGNWFLMRLLPYLAGGEIDGVLLTLIDITALKESERQLATLSEIVKSSQDAIFRVTSLGQILTWNLGAEHLFGYLEESIIGKSIEEIFCRTESQQRIKHALLEIQSGARIPPLEMEAIHHEGSRLQVQVSLSPIVSAKNSEANKTEGASIIVRDISLEKAAQQKIEDEVRKRDRFLAMLSHELRNPTAAIVNALSVIQRKDIDANVIENGHAIVQKNVLQLSQIINDLLHISRITNDKLTLNLKPVNLAQTARQVVDSLSHMIEEKQHQVELSLPDEPSYIFVDEARIIQAQTNLLVNAIKYTPPGGSISYRLDVGQEQIDILISDNGEGMSQELAEQAFEIFVQADQDIDRSKGGMGLGLPLVKMIIEAHGGSVTAFSEGLGLGSEFKLTIPRYNAPEDRTTQANIKKVSLKSRRLLLVEDNPGSRAMLAEFLGLEGLDVRTAGNGLDALGVYDSFLPEICLVDIGLPDLDGFEVAKRIRTLETQPKLLVALTGYGQEKDKQAVLAAGFDLHLVKPIEPDDLVSKIRNALID